jgi:hypothetical protein
MNDNELPSFANLGPKGFSQPFPVEFSRWQYFAQSVYATVFGVLRSIRYGIQHSRPPISQPRRVVSTQVVRRRIFVGNWPRPRQSLSKGRFGFGIGKLCGRQLFIVTTIQEQDDHACIYYVTYESRWRIAKVEAAIIVLFQKGLVPRMNAERHATPEVRQGFNAHDHPPGLFSRIEGSAHENKLWTRAGARRIRYAGSTRPQTASSPGVRRLSDAGRPFKSSVP